MVGRILNVGLIGCGAFAQITHIPNLKSNPKYKIHAAMDIDAAAAQKVQAETGAAYSATDVNRLLSDKNIDVVFITTRHDSHADLSIKAANAGKHILCEKPMGLDSAQCKNVAAAVQKNRVKYTVGYNRGLAPLIVQACDLLSELPQKKMLYHRLQAVFPEDHWIHDPEIGGGRFVGEGCHIFDLFCELIKSEPVSVYASGGIFLNKEKVKSADSGIITLSFADGSVATTLIASAGCNDFPKEVTEIYCSQKAIYIDNFQKLDYFGFAGRKHTHLDLGVVDKGQAREIDLFANSIINETESPNGCNRASRAAVISFKVVESLTKGMPVDIVPNDYKFV
ncbi:MAG: hypothetical protein A2Y12_17915 [Planctomycetes bacterium GWF2_42_9]|nr:MAG: hypothetical protein A2Y12_17915 [Planctomycetes bacterium GWF2_42_9]